MIVFSIHTQTKVALDELDTQTDFLDDGKMSELKDLAEKQLKDSILKTTRTVQEKIGKDAFGYGDILHRVNPDAWYRVRQDWDDVFKKMEIDVSCQINITNPAAERAPVKVGN
jgi:spore germination protein KC